MTEVTVVEVVVESPVRVIEIETPGLQGIPGPVGPTNRGYDHVQAAPSTLWTIAHNLGFRPSVSAVSTGGVRMDADVLHLSADVLTVSFLIPVAGSAHLV